MCIQWLKCLRTQPDYWQIAFLQPKFVKVGLGGTLQERLHTTKWQHLCKMIDGSCLLQAGSVVIWSLIKHEYRLRKRKANVASNIHSHQHLMGHALMMGPALMAGAHAENGVPSCQSFHFNHWPQTHRRRHAPHSTSLPCTASGAVINVWYTS